MFLDIVTKKLQKKFAKVTNSFHIYTSTLTITLVGVTEKSTTKCTLDTFANGRTRQDNTQKYQFYQLKKHMQFIYLLYPFQTGKSYSTICLIYRPINYFHCIVGHSKPSNSELCLNILESIKHTTRYTVQKKSRITVKHLYKFYSHFGVKRMSLANLRTMLICGFSFMGFFRFSEVINIRRTDVVIKNIHIAVFIEKSKQTSIEKEFGSILLG